MPLRVVTGLGLSDGGYLEVYHRRRRLSKVSTHEFNLRRVWNLGRQKTGLCAQMCRFGKYSLRTDQIVNEIYVFFWQDFPSAARAGAVSAAPEDNTNLWVCAGK